MYRVLNDSPQNTDFSSFISSLDEAILNEKSDSVYSLLHNRDFYTIQDKNLSLLIDWAYNWLDKLTSENSQNVVNILVQFLTIAPKIFDNDECFLLLVGQIVQKHSVATFPYIIQPLITCLDSSNNRFVRLKPAFLNITLFFKDVVDGFFKGCSFTLGDEFLDTLKACNEFYHKVITTVSLSRENKTFLCRHLLFLISRPFYIGFSRVKITEPLFLFTLCFSQLTDGLYSSYRVLLQTLEKTLCNFEWPCQIEPSLFVPAWLQIIYYFRFDADLSRSFNVWPLVFSKEYYFTLFYPLLLMIIDPCYRNLFTAVQNSSCDHAVFSLSETLFENIQIFALSTLKTLFQKSECLKVSWWTSQNVRLFEALEKLATQPVASENLPRFVAEAVTCTEQIFYSCSYSARFFLFAKLLNPNQCTIHSGWRGHIIKLFKDSLHELCTASLNSPLSSKLSLDQNESTQMYIKNIRQLFTFIFSYPLKAQQNDDIIDESSWILSALNLSLYILLRSKSASSSLVHEMLGALIRQFNDSENAFIRDFLTPLRTQLAQKIDQCLQKLHNIKSQLNVFNGKDPKLNSEMKVQESVMLRLRLLELTLNQTEEEFADLMKHNL